MKTLHIIALSVLISVNSCKKKNGGIYSPVDPPPTSSEVIAWLTKGDQSALVQQQSVPLNFGSVTNQFPTIEVDSTQTFQTIDGFGFTLTGGSADLINGLGSAVKQNLLRELFSADENGIGISYLRISIGASDLNANVFSYDHMPAGQTDTGLQYFSLSYDTINLTPVLKEIIAINPSIKILGSPWSAPVWMKNNNSSVGGSLLPQYYAAYANYFVKYIRALQMKEINIDAITVQNEPMHGGNNPSMLMTAAEQASFIKNHLGPAFRAANISVKIIIWDHNCDNPGYPLEILNDPVAKQFINGSAFHLYGGNISALSQVHNTHPDKDIYFTEQYTASNGIFATDLKWHLRNVIIGSMRNWSRNALEWNLANDPSFGPHTQGGCNVCKGAVTIGAGITRNVSYYIIAHASKFIPPGSVRIASNLYGSLQNVAFIRPDGKKVLLIENDGASAETFNVKWNGKWFTAALDGGAVATYVW